LSPNGWRRSAVKRPKAYHINGLTILPGASAGHPVVLLQSGVSMVNAAMNTQLVIDRFNVKRIVWALRAALTRRSRLVMWWRSLGAVYGSVWAAKGRMPRPTSTG
jgi:hypothetical protein